MEQIFFSLSIEIFIAFLGGGFILSARFIIERYRNWQLEKKYSAEGDYISEYEDLMCGEMISIKASVHIEQQGREIKGTTEFSGRTWILEGEISDEGYIYGIYRAEDVHDRGVGNFFLEIKIDGVMEGLWSGYDSMNKKIQSGRYKFTKKHTFEIKPITKKQVPTILHIAEKQLGTTYIGADNVLQDDGISAFVSISGKIAGFCTGKIISIPELYKSIPQLKEKKLEQLQVLDSVGLVASVATAPTYSGRGVGSALVEYCVSKLEEKGINVSVMTAWRSEKGVHIGSIAEKHGFQKIMDIDKFWKNDSLKHGYSCPSCGTPPCECIAVVYLKYSC